MAQRRRRPISPAVSDSTDSVHEESSDDESRSQNESGNSFPTEDSPALGKEMGTSLESSIVTVQREKQALEKEIRMEKDRRTKAEEDLAEHEKSFRRSEEAWKKKLEGLENDSERMLTQKVRSIHSQVSFIPIALCTLLIVTANSNWYYPSETWSRFVHITRMRSTRRVGKHSKEK